MYGECFSIAVLSQASCLKVLLALEQWVKQGGMSDSILADGRRKSFSFYRLTMSRTFLTLGLEVVRPDVGLDE